MGNQSGRLDRASRCRHHAQCRVSDPSCGSGCLTAIQARMELVNSFPSSYRLKQDELNEAVTYQNLYLDAMNSDDAYDKVQAAYAQLRARGVRGLWNRGTKEQLRAQWTSPTIDFHLVACL